MLFGIIVIALLFGIFFVIADRANEERLREVRQDAERFADCVIRYADNPSVCDHLDPLKD